MDKDGASKMDRQNKIYSCARESKRRQNNAGTDEEEKKLAGSLAQKELPAEGCSRRNGKWEEGSQQKISDDRQHNDKWTECRYEKKAEKRVEWRMLSLQ